MVRRVLTGVVLSAVLAMLASPVFANEASITYRFEGPYRGAFQDSVAHWNAVAERQGAPRLVPSHTPRRPDLVVRGMCAPKWHNGEVRGRFLRLNVCNKFTWEERRKLYSHELGHVYDLEHMQGHTVMREYLVDIPALYPTRKDGRALRRNWN